MRLALDTTATHISPSSKVAATVPRARRTSPGATRCGTTWAIRRRRTLARSQPRSPTSRQRSPASKVSFAGAAGPTGAPQTSPTLLAAFLDACESARIVVQNNGLTGNKYGHINQNVIEFGFQTASALGTGLGGALRLASSLGASFVEVYYSDATERRELHSDQNVPGVVAPGTLAGHGSGQCRRIRNSPSVRCQSSSPGAFLHSLTSVAMLRRPRARVRAGEGRKRPRLSRFMLLSPITSPGEGQIISGRRRRPGGGCLLDPGDPVDDATEGRWRALLATRSVRGVGHRARGCGGLRGLQGGNQFHEVATS